MSKRKAEATPTLEDPKKREAYWKQHVEAESDRIVAQVCEPLTKIRSKWNRYHIIGLNREFYHELRRGLIGSTEELLPGAEYDRALQATDQSTFLKWCQIGVYALVNQKLRWLQFDLLDFPEPPLAFATAEEEQQRQQRLRKRRALHTPRTVRRKEIPSFEMLFVEGESFLRIVNLLVEAGWVSKSGHWVLGERRNYKAQVLALMRVLQEKHYLKAYKYAELTRSFSNYFGVGISASYSSRYPGQVLMEEFDKLIPERQSRS